MTEPGRLERPGGGRGSRVKNGTPINRKNEHCPQKGSPSCIPFLSNIRAAWVYIGVVINARYVKAVDLKKIVPKARYIGKA